MGTDSGRGQRYLEDFHVGQRFRTAEHEITEAEIVAFAAEFDPQPFHLDHAAGAESVLGGLAASGWHTAAVTMRLQVQGDLMAGGELIGAGGEINWPAPTRPGDILRVETEVLEVRPSRSRPDRGILTILARTMTRSDTVVQTLRAHLVVPRRPRDAHP